MSTCVVCGRELDVASASVDSGAGWVCDEHVPAGRRERLGAMRDLATQHGLTMICVAPAPSGVSSVGES